MKKRAPQRDDFYAGVNCALAIVAAFDDDVMFGEIVKACGRENLLRVSRKNGNLRLDGFVKYGYTKRNRT